MKFRLTRSILYIITAAALAFSIQGSAGFAYEPTYNEILIQKERLATFCKMRDNHRKYDVCEKYKKLKGKLPDRISEIDTFRKIYEQKSK